MVFFCPKKQWKTDFDQTNFNDFNYPAGRRAIVSNFIKRKLETMVYQK